MTIKKSFFKLWEGDKSFTKNTNMITGGSIVTHFRSLKPTFDPISPLKLVEDVKWQHWRDFLIAFLGWTGDVFDFYTINVSYPQLAKVFGENLTDITFSVPVVLALRCVRAAIFGFLSD
jgi:MFS transporter, SHS family, lactate transporter